MAFRTTLTASPLLCTGRMLDTLPEIGASPMCAAFSTRKVRTAYRGPCMRVRRVNDNTEADIGFVQTDIDVKALLAFSLGFDCLVTTWYDQTGRGRHARQTDAGLQPYIVQDGAAIYDTSKRQLAVRFNGSFLITDWEPGQNSELDGGVSMHLTASTGVSGKQIGTVSESVQTTPPLDVVTDFPNPVLPEGHDAFLLEGVRVARASPLVPAREEVVYAAAGNLRHMTVYTSNNTVQVVDTAVPVSSGPPSLTVQTLSVLEEGAQEPATPLTSQWRHAVKAGNRIFAVPYNADVVLEINHLAVNAVDRIKRIALPAGTTSATKKYYTAVTSANGLTAYCLPDTANYVLEIDASTTPASLSYVGENYNQTDAKWRSGALSTEDGCIYAAPFNATTVLRIKPKSGAEVANVSVVGNTVNSSTQVPLGLPGSGGLFGKTIHVSGGVIIGVPWNAGCMMRIDTNASRKAGWVAGAVANVSLHGTTGTTAQLGLVNRRLSNTVEYRLYSGGRGYTASRLPELTVTSPGAPGGITGTPTQLTCSLQVTNIVSEVTVTATTFGAGSGYTSQPTVTFGPLDGTSVSNRRATASSPSLVPVDPANLLLGYKLTGSLNITDGGDGYVNTPPLVTIRGGKGTDANGFAQATVVSGSVNAISVPSTGAGSGYVTDPVIELRGGGGRGATARVLARQAIAYAPGSAVALATPAPGTPAPGSIIGVEVTSGGVGYKTPPTVVFTGGKGVDATISPSNVTMRSDGKIMDVGDLGVPSVGGGGYRVETAEDAKNATLRQIYIQHPGDTIPAGNKNGIRAIARVSANNSTTGAITKISMVEMGSGYVVAPRVYFKGGAAPSDAFSATNVPTQAAEATAVFEVDGRLADVVVSQQGTLYTQAPVITGLNVRDDLQRSGASLTTAATGGIGSIYAEACVFLEGNCAPTGVQQSTLRYNYNVNFGGGKFSDAYVYSNAVYCVPYNSNRVLRIDTGNVTTATDVQTFGTGFARWSSGATNVAGTSFYGIPETSGRILLIQPESSYYNVVGPQIKGQYNVGVTAYNDTIYCMPSSATSLLVIDCKIIEKSEQFTFSNVRGQVANKWWGGMRAGSTASEGIIYGIPADLTTVLEINPGVPLREASLPARGTALPDSRVVFAPSKGNVLVYDAITRTGAKYPVAGANVSYAEGVAVNGNVIFVPVYNQSDSFQYSGNIGVFNTSTNTFSYDTVQVNPRYAAPYPSRCALKMGAASSNIVAWVPRGSAADNTATDGGPVIIEYNHTPGDGVTSKITTAITKRALVDVRVDYATGQLVDSQKAVFLVPANSTVSLVTAGPNGYSSGRQKFGGAVLTSVVDPLNPESTKKIDVVVLVPAQDEWSVVLFYPAYPGQALNVSASTTTRITRIEADLDPYIPGYKFMGAVLGSDGKVYCVPHNARRVLMIDPASYSADNIGDEFVVDADTISTDFSISSDQPQLWWGAVLGGDGKIYCVPYNATRVLVIDPSVQSPVGRLSFLSASAGDAAIMGGPRKWSGGALAPDGRIVCAPFDSDKVLVIDPAAQSLSFVGGFTWLTSLTDATGSGAINKFSGCFVGSDRLVYLVPHSSQLLVGLGPTSASDATMTPKRVIDTKLVGSDKFSGAVISSGSAYFIPKRSGESVSYSFDTLEITRVPAFSSGGFDDNSKWSCGIVMPDGTVYAFPSWRNDVLKITPPTNRLVIYDRDKKENDGEGEWTTCGTLASPFRLRPFRLAGDDGNSKEVLFHTSGKGGAYAIFDANAATSRTQAIVGPSVRDSVSVMMQEYDRVVGAIRSNVTVITSNEGGIAGVKSFSGNAELYAAITGSDLDMALGRGRVGNRRIFQTLLRGGQQGTVSALASNAAGTVNFYVRDVPIEASSYSWSGQVGNTFAVGTVRGTLTSGAGYNAPAYTRGFNGLISEVVVLAGDQQARAPALGDSAAFYFLDSTLQVPS